MEIDYFTGNYIGAGESVAFDILKEISGLQERPYTHFPRVGIYRQVPVILIYDNDQLTNLADYHKKSSVDIFLVTSEDEYNPRYCKIAVRIEGKKGDFKMVRQGVQKRYLGRWCQVVDIHKRDAPELFKNRNSEKSRNEIFSAFKVANVELPYMGDLA